jgi:chromosome segregation ATPase
MPTDDITVQVLVEIRDEIRSTNRRLDATNERLERLETTSGQLVERIDGTNQRLDRLENRLVESEIRLATAITDMHGTLQDVQGRLKGQLDLRVRVERCERDIDDIKKRLT